MLLQEADDVYTCTSLVAEESASERELYIVTVRRARGSVDECKVS